MTQSPTIIEVSWAKEEPRIRAVREQVFMHEQGVSAELEWDEYDAESRHWLALDGKRDAVGTGRLQPDAKITRLAVLSAARGTGVGKALFEALLIAAVHQGAAIPWLHAQADAVGFYEQFGFERVGEPFMEAGIAHQKMRMSRT